MGTGDGRINHRDVTPSTNILVASGTVHEGLCLERGKIVYEVVVIRPSHQVFIYRRES